MYDKWTKLINDVYAMEPKPKDNQRLSRAMANGCYAMVCEELHKCKSMIDRITKGI